MTELRFPGTQDWGANEGRLAADYLKAMEAEFKLGNPEVKK